MADTTNQRMVRSFSSSNLHATKRIHEYISNQERNPGYGMNLAREVTKSSMIIPTFNKMMEIDPRLARYTLGLVTDNNALDAMERDDVINWCMPSRTLVPLTVDPDGNCLMHSISVYIWGVHDRRLNLRRFLHRKLVGEDRFDGKIYLRWKYEQEKALHTIQTGFDSCEVRREWDTVVDGASLMEYPRGNHGQKYLPLEDIHIFVASNVIARPIIVLSDKIHRGPDGRSLQPNQISGIYLPLLRNPAECEKSPVIIGYLQGHFVPLLSGEDHKMPVSDRAIHPDAQHCVPLVYKDLSEIPIRFTQAEEQRDDLLNNYLDCFSIPLQDQRTVPAVILKFKPPPAWSVELMWSLFAKAQQTFFANVTTSSVQGSEYNNGPRVSVNTQVTGHPIINQAASSRIPDPPSSSSQTQAPTSSGYRYKDDDAVNGSIHSQSDRPCIGRGYGCRNLGEVKYQGMCRVCFEDIVSPANTRATRERSEVMIEKRVPTSAYNHPARKIDPPAQNRRPDPMGPQGYGANASLRNVGGEKCIISSCNRRGNAAFHDMCKECFTTKIEEQVAEAAPNLKHATAEDQRQDQVQNPPKSRIGKLLCADPGCQEQPSPGEDKCANCIGNRQDMPKCLTENCQNRAVDKEFFLCEECRRKQVQAAVEEHQEPRTDDIGFQAPVVYPAYPPATRPMTSTTATGKYDTPKWQEAHGGRNPHGERLDQGERPLRGERPLQGTGLCRSTYCDHFAAPDKEGLCNECFAYGRRSPQGGRSPQGVRSPQGGRPPQVFGLEERPLQGIGRQERPPKGNGLCRETLCEHFAAQDKDGLCNECFSLKLQFRQNEQPGHKCRNPSCTNKGDPTLAFFCQNCFPDTTRLPRGDGQPIPGSPHSPRSPSDGQLPASSRYPGIPQQMPVGQGLEPRRSPVDGIEQPMYGNLPASSYLGDFELRHPPSSTGQPMYGTAPGRTQLQRSRDRQSESGGIVNTAYQPGLYSNTGNERNRGEETNCVMGGCRNKAERGKNGLCNACFEQSVKEEELISAANRYKKQQQQAERVQKLPADSPYRNPVPCKTMGCPFVRSANSEYCDNCSRRGHGTNPSDLAASQPNLVNSQANFVNNQSSTVNNPPGISSYSSAITNSGYHSYVNAPMPAVSARDPVGGQRAEDQGAGNQEAGRRRNQSVSGYIGMANQQSQQCATPFCEFFASGEFGPYCSKCFMDRTKGDARSAIDTEIRSNSDMGMNRYNLGRGPVESGSYSLPGSASAMPCRSVGCTLFGRPERNGYCSQCYGH